MAKIVWDRKVLGRFLSKLNIPEDRSNCWLWEGAITEGYGKIRIYYDLVFVHRLAYTIFVGEIPESKCILHSCDIRNCCNPTHLFPGTHQDNMRDMCNKCKNYMKLGEDNPESKLKNKDIPKIRRMLSCGYPQKHIGKVFGVSCSAISWIKCGKSWEQ